MKILLYGQPYRYLTIAYTYPRGLPHEYHGNKYTSNWVNPEFFALFSVSHAFGSGLPKDWYPLGTINV